MGRQIFEVNGEALGERKIDNFRNIPGFDIRPTDSYAYFCHRCGEIWGRLRHEGGAFTQCVHRSCEKHGDGRLGMMNPGGSPCGLSEDWPRTALFRELQLEIAITERFV